jgi:hypothetical protein
LTKQSTPLPPLLDAHVGDARAALDGIADPHRVDEFEPPAGPHAARQRHRRQEAAARRVAVWAEGVHRHHRRRQAPVHGERRRRTDGGVAGGTVERDVEFGDEARRDDVGGGLGAADPGAEGVDVERHGSLPAAAVGERASFARAMAGTKDRFALSIRYTSPRRSLRPTRRRRTGGRRRVRA